MMNDAHTLFNAQTMMQIVAGLEPENTNVFLQMLGNACRVNDGADAVQVQAMQSNPAGGSQPQS